MKILITGFDPFGGEEINPALEAVKLIDSHKFAADIIKLEVPTVFGQSIEHVAQKIREVEPDVVLAIGQAGGRAAITPERVAINLDDARIPDNVGKQPIDVVINETGAPAYFATIPIKAMVEAVRSVGVPAAVSNTAGTFVCNHLMYGILDMLQAEYPSARGGFVHVPFIPEQVVHNPSQPSMGLQDIVRGLEASLQAIIDHEQDIKVEGGAIS